MADKDNENTENTTEEVVETNETVSDDAVEVEESSEASAEVIDETTATDDVSSDEFLEIFNQNKQVLAKSDGCIRLEIFKSTNDTDTYFTISNWQSEDHLEMYRQSELFKDIWSKVKPLFNNKAQAWTLNTLN